jgi:transposase
MMGTLAGTQRKLIVTTSRTKRSTDFIAHLQALEPLRPRDAHQAGRHGARQRPDPRQQGTRAALAERAHWLTVEWLPKYAPELNDIEVVWGDLKAHQPRGRRLEFRAKTQSVGQPTNLCLGNKRN